MSHWDLYEMDCDIVGVKPSFLEFIWIEIKYYLGIR